MARRTHSQLQQASLYGILDLGYVEPEDLLSVAREMISGGVDVIQLRAKNHDKADVENWSRELIHICRDNGVPFIVNDHADVAAAVGSDGVHVGQDDLSMDEVRKMVGPDMLVGRSTHSVEQAAAAAADERTDCIGFGPLFATPTKPDYRPIGMEEIRSVHEAHPGLPIFCIGGIKLENLEQVMAAGALRVVIVSGILQAPDIRSYVSEVKLALRKK